MTSDGWQIVLAFLAGGGLGLLYFGGLWWTLRRWAGEPRLLPIVAISFLVRTAVTLAGFYLVMGDRLTRLIVCLLGFVLVRRLVVRRYGMPSSLEHTTSPPSDS